MRLQETILEAIKPENFERKEKNVFTLDYDSTEVTFDDVDINIKGQKWESYIDLVFDVGYTTDHCSGDNDTPPSSHWEVDYIGITYLNIEVDGLRITLSPSFMKQVKEEIKKQLIFEIE